MSIYTYLGLAVVAVVTVVSFARAIVRAPVACVECERRGVIVLIEPGQSKCPACGHELETLRGKESSK